MRPKDQENNAIKKKVCYSSRKGGAHWATQSPVGKHQGPSAGVSGVGDNMAGDFVAVFTGKQVKAG